MCYNIIEVNDMAFNTKKRKEFLESLKNIEISQPLEEDLIKEFVPTGLSNLYELFLKLKDTPLSDSQFNHFSNMISMNYPKNIAGLIHNPITDNEISQLLEIIKQEYLEIVNTKNQKNVSEEEQNRLKIIVNRFYPEVFLDFIENPISSDDFSKQQRFINDAIINLIYDYYKQTTPHGQKNLDCLGSAIYLIYRKLHPELSLSDPERGKGKKSFNDNMHKELNRSLQNTVADNIRTGIMLSDIDKHIISNEENKNNFTDKADADISAMTIVLNHVDDAIYFDENDPENEEILKLKKQRNENLRFMHSVKKYLNENDIFMTQEEYFQIYIELLHRLQNSTYPECTHEIKEGSYSSRLKYAIENYKKNMETDSFAPNATDIEIEELHTLLDCLKRRLDDKLQHEILRVTFPHVLADPLLVDDFKITGSFIKDVKKENGFCAIYYELTDALDRKIEVQLQSNMRYKETKNGLSTHNDMPNKQANIKPFFELVDKNTNPELLEHYLFLLGRTSRNQEEALKQKLELLKEQASHSRSSKEKMQLDTSIRKLEKKISAIETAKNSIKIKDEFIEEVDMIDTDNTKKEDNYELKNINGKQIKVYNTKTTKRTSKMTIEQYLPIYAEYYSPSSMSVISSAHATAPEAHVNRKTLVEGFTEILRKGDEITYLSEMLINKLKEILNIQDINQYSLEELRRYAKDLENGFYAPEEKFWKPTAVFRTPNKEFLGSPDEKSDNENHENEER